MAKAPSERHLEDWIVANLDLFGTMDSTEEDGEWCFQFIVEIIRRQMRLPSGIADLIGFCDRDYTHLPLGLCVVELKAGTVDTKVLAQCLKYMRDMQEIYYHSYISLLQTDEHVQLPIDIETFPWRHYNPINGLLVGHSISDENLPTICELCNIGIATYDYDPDSDSYTFDWHEGRNPGRLTDYEEYSYGILGETFRRAHRTYIEHLKRGTWWRMNHEQ